MRSSNYSFFLLHSIVVAAQTSIEWIHEQKEYLTEAAHFKEK